MDCIARHECEDHSSLLLLCGSQGSNSGHQAWQQAPLSAEASQQPSLVFFPKIYVCLFVFMCMGVCLHVCICTTYVPGVLGNQKRVLDPMKLVTDCFSLLYGCWELNPFL